MNGKVCNLLVVKNLSLSYKINYMYKGTKLRSHDQYVSKCISACHTSIKTGKRNPLPPLKCPTTAQGTPITYPRTPMQHLREGSKCPAPIPVSRKIARYRYWHFTALRIMVTPPVLGFMASIFTWVFITIRKLFLHATSETNVSSSVCPYMPGQDTH